MAKKIILILLLTFPVLLTAQGSGSSGLAFLKLGADARTVSLSDLGATPSFGTASLFYNPAFLSDSSGFVNFSHNSYIQDVSAENFGVTFKILGAPFGLSFNTTSVSDIEIRNRPGEPSGTFSAHYFSAALSSAFDLTKFLRFGVTAKYLYEGMFTDESYGYAFDFGLKSASLVKNLQLGFVARNIGKMNNLRSVPTEVPAGIRLGAEYSLPVNSLNFQITLLGGAQEYLKESKMHLHGGAEITYKNQFAFRIGYASNYDSKSLSAGLGIKWKNISFDYAYVPYNYNLGSVHFITISGNVSSLF